MRDTGQQWFKDAKYGLFIHWGLYAILAGEYNGRRTDNIAEWIMNDLDIPIEEYEKLAAQFNPVRFDADTIVRRARDWGMKYLTFTAKHHDGFAMYHSRCNPYNIVDATPFGRDVTAELAQACAKYGLKFCLYYSQAQDWHDPNGYRAHHPNEHKNFRNYLDEKCIPQLRELLTGYGEIGMIWFDTPMDMTATESRELYDLVKSIQPDCIVSGRIGNDLGQYMTTGDNDIPALPFYGDWEVPATLNDTWGYNQYDHHWKSPQTIIRLLLKINSRGGNYLLNIGPMADGSIPAPSIDILDAVGAYVARNGESLYGTRAVAPYVYEREDLVFTAKEHSLFIHLLTAAHRICLGNIANTIHAVTLLPEEKPLVWKQGKNCEGESQWTIQLPEDIPENGAGCVIRVATQEPCPVFEALR